VGRIAGTYPLAETYHTAALKVEMERVTNEVSGIVPEATGLSILGKPSTVVIDRTEWIDRNVAAFSHLTEPARQQLEERMSDSVAGQNAASFAAKVMQTETRAVLSVLSRKVLGQYEWFSLRVKRATWWPMSVPTSCNWNGITSSPRPSSGSGLHFTK